ncbi:MAG: hypothetical protein VCD00_10235 [Candidatus Hydrogenedentota bacterium]
MQVYVFQSHVDGPPLISGIDRFASQVYQSDGPLTSDSEGYVSFESFVGPEGGTVVHVAYAVLPNQRVGIWTHINRDGITPLVDDARIEMVESKTVPGQFLLPEGYDLSAMQVDTMHVRIPTPRQPYAFGFGSYSLEGADAFPGLFGVSVDASGHFVVPDLPKEGAFKSGGIDYAEIGFGTVAGRALDEDGEPIAGVRVSGSRKYKQGEDMRQYGPTKLGRTDDDGRFSVEVQALGEHKIIVGGNAWSADEGDWIRVAKDESAALDDVYLVAYTLQMSVKVVDEEGRPLSDVLFLFSIEDYLDTGIRLRTDSEGMIYLKNLPDTEIQMQARREGYEHSDWWKGFASEHVEIVLKPEL